MTAHAKIDPATELPPGFRTDRMLMLADYLERPETKKHFRMDGWFIVNGDRESWTAKLEDPNHCGTTACIAGHAAWLFNKDAQTLISCAAQQALGLTDDQADELFEPRDEDGQIANYTNLQAAAAVRHLALTGEVLWK